MRQKFVISQDGARNKLKIMEYAIVDKIPKDAAALLWEEGSYKLLGVETYDSDIVESSIPKGRRVLVSVLRTYNLFPIEPYAKKIAESIIALYKSENEDSAELFFDDVDLLTVPEYQGTV